MLCKVWCHNTNHLLLWNWIYKLGLRVWRLAKKKYSIRNITTYSTMPCLFHYNLSYGYSNVSTLFYKLELCKKRLKLCEGKALLLKWINQWVRRVESVLGRMIVFLFLDFIQKAKYIQLTQRTVKYSRDASKQRL